MLARDSVVRVSTIFATVAVVASVLAACVVPGPDAGVARVDVLRSEKPRLPDLLPDDGCVAELVAGNRAFAFDLCRELLELSSGSRETWPFSRLMRVP